MCNKLRNILYFEQKNVTFGRSSSITTMRTSMLCAFALLMVGMFAAPSSALAQKYIAAMESVQPTVLLAGVAVGQSLVMSNVLLDQEDSPVALELRRFEVFAPDARIVVHGPGGEESLDAPTTGYFQGKVQGVVDSLVVLSADSQGIMRGIVQQGEKFWILAGGAEAGGPITGLASREIKQSGLSDVVARFQEDSKLNNDIILPPHRTRRSDFNAKPLAAGQLFDVRVAIETDGEFFGLFGNTTSATRYIGDLFAYASVIYQREANSRLVVGDISLWAGGSNSDPWSHSDTHDGLINFQNYWNTNHKSVKRAIAHFLSGRNLGGGIAYLGVLCDSNYGYGYSAGLQGNFQISNPQPVWDVVVVSHEIGHNFNSPHTHCYGGIGGNANPVDACHSGEGGSGCWAGGESLPGLNSLTGGAPSSGKGTLMSYCHLLGGGMSNLSLTFGQNHQYGISASRVSTLMSNYVNQVASSNPSCITVTNTQAYTLTVGKIGSGTVTSNPAGISCGSDCAETYSAGATVTMTAAPDSGFTFAGWSGACSGTGSCSVKMDSARSVTATFSSAANPSSQALITQYYQAILSRIPDSSGLAFWQSEIQRLQILGVDVQEAFRVMAGQFFTSTEYLSRNTSDTQYITDLYQTFFNRGPDSGGLNYWIGQLAAGSPRSLVMFYFLFSPEFASYMQGLFGNTVNRGEVYAVVDFYRGFLNRLPDSNGFNYWLERFRAAQCQGAWAVVAEVDSISRQFLASTEYVNRQRSSRDYVADMYYAFLRRGGDVSELYSWVAYLDTGTYSREQVRQAFINSPEFQSRVNQIINQGCLR